MKRYVSDYSNQLHQLIVTVSRHYYVTKEGKYKRQQKPFNVQLDTIPSNRKHVIHFLIRDHFSGLFYAEITDSKNIPSVYEFLYRAWSKKAYHPMYGAPLGITIPQNIAKAWPGITDFIDELGITQVSATSGFQSGVRDIRTWEDRLKSGLYISGFPPDFSEVIEKSSAICKQIALSSPKKASKEEVWRHNLRDILVPSSKEEFLANIPKV